MQEEFTGPQWVGEEPIERAINTKRHQQIGQLNWGLAVTCRGGAGLGDVAEAVVVVEASVAEAGVVVGAGLKASGAASGGGWISG